LTQKNVGSNRKFYGRLSRASP